MQAIGKIINRLLYRYDSSNYITRNRARFILYLILTIIVIAPLIIIYFSYIHVYNPSYEYAILMSITIPTSAAFILSLISLLFLVKGHFSIAGNMLLIIWQSAFWGIIFLAEEELLIRVDTVIFIAATLMVMPIIITHKKFLFILYPIVNLGILFLFILSYKNNLYLSESAMKDFLSVNTIAYAFIGIVSYTIFSINSGALEKAESEITERKKTEDQRNRLQMQLLQSQKLESVGLLAGGVAHDFNNMLAAIQGFAELASENIDSKSPAEREIKEIIRASKKARDLTRQLLAFARIQPYDMKNININQLVNDFSEMLSRTLRGNILIKKNLCDDPGSIEGDPVQIEQVILNLALNAQDAMPDGGTITIETSRMIIGHDKIKGYENIIPGPYIMLSVTDSGSGIESDIIDDIFIPFFTTKDFGKGTGLGLSTVYGIIKQHNGMIDVYTEKNKGTIFKIYLPVNDEAAANETITPPNLNFPKGNETILAVEDTDEVRNLLEKILTKNGYTAFITEDAGAAIKIASTYDGIIHMLITDVMMPDMNGMDLYRRISEIRPGIKAIYISGYTANVIAHNGKLDEGVCFIQKPFSISEFTKKIRDLLDS